MDIEEKFSKNLQDTETFKKLVYEYTKKEEWQKLIEIYEKHAQAIEKDDKEKTYEYYLLAAKWQKIHFSFNENTVHILEKAFALFPEREEAICELELFYQSNKKQDDLIKLYDKQLQKASISSQENLCIKIANIYRFEKKDIQKALSFYERAYELNSKNKNILYSLAEIYKELKEKRKHVEILNSLVEVLETIDEKDIVFFELGEIYFDLQEFNKAAVNYRKIAGNRFELTVMERLEKIYSSDGANLVLILTQKLDNAKSVSEKIDLYLEIAKIKDEELNEPDVAILFYERAFKELQSPEILERICNCLWQRQRIDEWFLYQMKKINLVNNKEEKAYSLHKCAVDLKRCEQSPENIDYLLEIYEKIIVLSPEDDIAIDYLTNTYKTLRRYESLLKILVHKSKYSSFSERVSIYFQIAKLLSESLNQQEEASVYYRRVMAIQGDHNEALQKLRNQYNENENYAELIKLIEDEIRVASADVELKYNEIGEIYRDKLHDASKAMEYFQKAIDANPLYVAGYTSLLELYKKLNYWDDFIEVGEKKLEIIDEKDKSIELHFAIANSYKERENIVAEKRHLHKILQYDPGEIRAIDRLLKIYLDSKEWQEYIQIIEMKAVFSEYSENAILAYQQIANIYETEIQNFEKAIDYYEKFHILFPENVDVIDRLIVLHEKTQNIDKAITYLEKKSIFAENSQYCAEIYKKIASLFEGKDTDNAILFYEKAYKKNSEDKEILLTLEKFYREFKNYTKLFSNLEAQLFIAPQEEHESLIIRLIELAMDYLQNTEKAIWFLKKWQKINFAKAYPQLEKIYQSTENWQELSLLYESMFKNISNDAEELQVLQKLMEIYENKLPNLYKLKNIYQKLLKKNSSLDIAHKLEKVAEEIKDWQGTLDICQWKSSIVTDSQELYLLFVKMARIYELYLGNIDQAIVYYNKAHEITQNISTLNSLKNLFIVKLDYQQALHILDSMSKINEDNVCDILLEKGDIYFYSLKEYSKALDCFKKVLTYSPHNKKALDKLEYMYGEEKDYTSLIEVLSKKCETNEDEKAYLTIARVWKNSLNNIEKAQQILEKAQQIFTQSEEIREELVHIYSEREEWSKLDSLYEQKEKHQANPSKKANILFLRGKIYEKELYDKKIAAAMYVKVLTLVPDHLPAIKSLQHIYKQENNLSALAESYLAELAIQKILPKRKEALHIFCAELFEKNLEEREWATTHYLQVLKIDPNNLVAIRGLQSIYRQSTEWQKLVDMLFSELSIEKNSVRLLLIYKELGEIHLFHLDSTEKATEYYIKAHETYPQETEVFNLLKKILKSQDLWNEYVSYFEEELVHLDPQSRKKAHLELANIYQNELENPEQAIAHLETYLENFDWEISILDLLEKLYKTKGAWTKLISVYERKLKITENEDEHMQLYFHIGNLYQKLENDEKTVEYLEKIILCKPDNKKVFNILSKLYAKTKSWDKLISLYLIRSRFTQSKEKQETIYFKIATIYEQKLKKIDDALNYYELSLVANLQNLEAIRGMCRLMEQKNDWGNVVDCLQREIVLVKEDKELLALHFKIGRILEQRLSLPHQAVFYYLKVLEKNYHLSTAEHTISLLKALRNYAPLSKIMWQMIQRTKDEKKKIEYLCELGEIFFKQLSETKKSIKMYDMVFTYNKDNLKALSALEEIYETEKNWEQLADIKTRKLSLLNSKLEIRNIHIDLGNIYENFIFQEKKAIDHYEKALELSQNDINLLHTLESLYKNWGYFKQYIELCHIEIKIIHDDIERKIYLWHEMAKTWEHRLFESNLAIECYEQMLALNKSNNEAIVALIRLYNYIEDYGNLAKIHKIQIALAQKVNVEHEIIPLKITVAKILKNKLKQLDEAEKIYREILEIDTANEEAIQALKDLYEHKNDIEGQGQVIEKEIQLEKDSAKIYALYVKLGKVYQNDSSFNVKAITAYEKSEEITSDLSILKILCKLYQEQNEHDNLIITNRKILEKHKITDKEVAELHFEIGCLLEESSKEQALIEFQQTIEREYYIREAFTKAIDILLIMERWDEASDIIKKQINKESDRKILSDLLFQRGNILKEKLDKLDEAQNCYERAIDQNPQNSLATFELANIFYEFHWWERAENLFKRISRLPTSEIKLEIEKLYYTLANIYLKRNMEDMAILHFQKSLEYKSDFFPALKALGDLYYDKKLWDEALLHYMKLENIQNNSEVDVDDIHLRLSIIKEKMGMTEGAIEGYIKHLKKDAESATALQSLGKLYSAKEEWETALEYYQKLIELHPQTKNDALTAIAEIYDKTNNKEACIPIYTELYQQHPQYMEKLVSLNCSMQRWDDALKIAQDGLNQATNHFEKNQSLMSLAKIYWQGKKDSANAIEKYKEALQILPKNFKAIYQMCTIFKDEEKFAELIKICQEYLKNFTQEDYEYIALLNLIAFCYLDNINNKEEAAQYFEKVLEIDPHQTEAHAALAGIWGGDKEKYEQAITEHFYLLLKDSFRLDSYHKLFELYQQQNMYDRMYLCCQAISSLGKLLPPEEELIGNVISRVPSGWLDAQTQNKFIPEMGRSTLYEIMASVDEYTDKVYLPNWTKYDSLKKKERFTTDEDTEMQDCIYRTLKFLSIDNIHIYTCNSNVIHLENTNPVSLVIGLDLWRNISKNAQKFLITRTLFYAARKQVMAYKLTSEKYNDYIAILVGSFANLGRDVSPEEDNLMRKFRNALPRKIRKYLEDNMDILTEIYRADSQKHLNYLEKAANNCGLLMSDSLKGAMEGYSYIKNIDSQNLKNTPYQEMIQELFCFNISEEHSLLRRELGLEIKWLK